VERLIGEDHPARAIWELVGKLDLSSFRQTISAVEGVAGRPALDPHLLISVWIYAYSEGVSSAREITRRCEYDPVYQVSKGRMVVRAEEAPAVVAFRAKMQTEAAKQIYRQRGQVAEFPFAWIKAKIGLRQFRLRGLLKVSMEAMWACLTHNIQQWIRLRWRREAALGTS